MYPYENAFKICEDYGWKFIYVLQDSSLITVQQELTLTRRKLPEARYYTVEHGWHITQEYRYQTEIEYHKKYKLNWAVIEPAVIELVEMSKYAMY